MTRGEWIECEDKRYCECSNCWVLVTKKEAEDFGDCPNCGSDNRPRENNSSSMIINGKYSENVEYGTRIEIREKGGE